LTGSGFASGCQVLINNVLATSTTFVNSTTVRAQLPATAAGTYIVYLANTDGSVGIRVNGVTFSANPSWQTSSSLSGNVDDAISIQLSATEATVFALQSGSTLPAGLTLSSGGLISGTVTGLSEETVYSFTVIASDAENQESPRTFSITITVGEQYFNRTVLAINADVGNTFASDASTNNFPITVVGDTRPSNFSPYNTNWSNEFDGTGDNLQIAHNSALNFDGDMTVECWIYLNTTAGIQTVASKWQPGNESWIWQFSSTTMSFYFSGTASSFAWTPSTNIWYHIAISRSSGSVKFFVNGVQTGSTSTNNTVANTTSAMTIGNNIDGPQQYLTGYISNFRLVKGTAVYTSNFTPSTTALTAIANTSLLTCQSNRLIDNSTNAFAITKAGDTKVSAFGPFTETDTTTGSGYFDGTGDSLSIAANNAFNVGTNDACVECWVYFNSTASNQTLNGQNSGAGSTMRIGIWSGLFQYTINDDTLRSSGVTALAGQWYHLALTITGGTTRYFINGILRATATGFTVNSRNETYFIGSEDSAQVLNGYMRDFRFTNGSIPVAYQTSSTTTGTQIFNVPTAPLTAVANTQILTLQTRQPVNNHTFIDASRNNLLVTKTGNPIQGSFSPFSPAGWSGYFDGSGDFLTTSSTTLLDVTSSTQSFTIEAWIYPTSIAASGPQNYRFTSILSKGVVYLSFGYTSTGILRWYTYSGVENYINSASGVINANQWQHVAIVSNAGSITLYVNGTSVATGTLVAPNGGTGVSPKIGHADTANASDALIGYISNFRTTTTAVYTTNFTPSESALTAIANTSLLTCQSNRFIDNSTNNFAITRNGDTAVVNFSPFKPTAAYSPITNGGSAYFDGSGDSTTATGNSLLLGSNNFTIEGWFYFNNGAENAIKIMCVNYTAAFVAGGIYFGKHSNNSGLVTVWIYNYSSSGPLLVDPTLPPTKEWVHYALVRSGNTWTLYRNGVSVATATSSASLFSTTNNFFHVGGSPGDLAAHTYNGYISGFKITNGTALYTSNFSVPTSPATASNNTSLLLNYNNAGIVDVSSRNVIETVGDAKIVTSTKKFGTGSMYFDGTGDYLVSPASVNYEVGTGSYTIEFWVYWNVIGQTALFGWNGGATGSTFGYTYSDGRIGVGINGTNEIVSSSGQATTGSWIHMAFVKNGSTTTIYKNGVAIASSTTGVWSSNTGTATFSVGGGASASNTNCYIDDFRITRFARYTANFTPPTSTFLVR
jgi:hypothetical protein